MGNDGACLKYKRGVEVARKVWLSPAFKERHVSLSHILTQAAGLPGSKWKVIEDRATFEAAVRQAVSTNRVANVLGVLRATEAKDRCANESAPGAIVVMK